MSTQLNVNQPLWSAPRPASDCSWRAQFACPSGRLGRLAGHVMAVKNAPMNRFAVATLNVQPTDQILEIGFGHGRAMQMIAAQATQGYVAGVDLSPVMVQQAARRNREAIKAGRAEICQGTVANLPYEYARFDKVLAVNNYQFWPNPEFNLVEIQRVLRTDGLLVLCLRMQEPKKALQLAPGFSEEEIKEVAGLVRWVGFRDVQMVQRRASDKAACVTAKR
jgi:ubiquinone/menaquinone biosynthesis C-methylase UbiE